MGLNSILQRFDVVLCHPFGAIMWKDIVMELDSWQRRPPRVQIFEDAKDDRQFLIATNWLFSVNIKTTMYEKIHSYTLDAFALLPR